jgi:hypothetical protein
MPIVGGLDIHRKQITFDYLDAETGEVKRGQVTSSQRERPPPDPKPPDPRGPVCMRAGLSADQRDTGRRRSSARRI